MEILAKINFELFDFYYVLSGFILGSLLFLTINLITSSKLQKEIKTLKRQYEKKSVGMDDSSLKVKTLENKIKTLEAALKKQLDND